MGTLVAVAGEGKGERWARYALVLAGVSIRVRRRRAAIRAAQARDARDRALLDEVLAARWCRVCGGRTEGADGEGPICGPCWDGHGPDLGDGPGLPDHVCGEDWGCCEECEHWTRMERWDLAAEYQHEHTRRERGGRDE